ncbi:hydrogenase accessory protein HypB [Chromobacterium phragmitis]|uniref:Hydrogenase maturation factor HypB n=1 Tax=Chromobacterium phragmitis TaxID=2202141 RepID=A0A344ULR9_9NEIS|nr:hydrogenase nickel incorporation protein HypB [Chromobacterium phragmitis]AXE30841.1 hydrogenase accessory protein HypB [Chromobacterium phragmitis]AXE36217.1 hydrogenase accessory protein HypB [Chromobacterium phragmitis]
MCTTCGCGHGQVSINGKRGHGHGAPGSGYRLAGQRHGPLDAAHAPDTPAERIVAIEQDILADNNARAARNRRLLAERGVFALNLVSSPGSGKTSLLVDTIGRWAGRKPVAVVEGDQQTANDAERIRAAGAPAVQINTGKGCHLDARMVAQALARLERDRAMPNGGLLLIENVGNLVCPAAFDLGEAHKVAILSVTEGEDKPLKYPDMFRAADLLIISKTDLLPHLDFDIAAAIRMARRVRPGLPVIRLSVKTGEGCDEWLNWLAAGCGEGG